MSEIHVNRRKQLSKVLSIRMTDQEFRHLQETLRNYGIHRDSLSRAVRVLLASELYRSRRYARQARNRHQHNQCRDAFLDLGIES
jgi:hypothetical protein